MYIIGLAIICFTIYAIVSEVCEYLKEKNKKEKKWYKWIYKKIDEIVKNISIEEVIKEIKGKLSKDKVIEIINSI